MFENKPKKPKHLFTLAYRAKDGTTGPMRLIRATSKRAAMDHVLTVLKAGADDVAAIGSDKIEETSE